VVGPDLPSGLRRPDRSVSLPDPREQPVQTMGFDWVYTDHGYETTSPGGTKVRITGPHKGNEAGSRGGKYWSIDAQRVSGVGEYEPTLADAKRVAEEQVPLHDEREEKSRVAQEENAQRREEGRQRREAQRAEAGAEGVAEMRGLGAELGGRLAGFPPTDMDTPLAPAEPPGQGIEDMESGVAAYPELPIGFMQGLTADQAFRQHQATSGVEQPRSDRAHPERPTPPTSREPWVPLSDEQNAINAEGIEEARKTLNGSRNPELRAMDSQMMTDLMAERAAQPEQGYFGGMGNAVQELTETVRAMSGEEQGMMIAALIAAGLLTAGSGGMLAPAGAALMGGAGIAALSQ